MMFYTDYIQLRFFCQRELYMTKTLYQFFSSCLIILDVKAFQFPEKSKQFSFIRNPLFPNKVMLYLQQDNVTPMGEKALSLYSVFHTSTQQSYVLNVDLLHRK